MAAGQSGAGEAGAGFLLFFLISGVTALVRNGEYPSARVVQPVVFSHQKHVEDEGLECIFCHRFYQKETFSGLPPDRICALCHSEPQGDSREEGVLVGMLQEGVPLSWGPLFRQPAHVFFSHRRHVSVAGLECPSCHGDIGSSDAPPERMRPLTMEQCLACHERENLSDDCSGCHR